MGLGLVLTPQSLLRLLRTLGKCLLLICGWKTEPAKLHNARFATKHELAAFQTQTLPATGLLLGTAQHYRLMPPPNCCCAVVGAVIWVGALVGGGLYLGLYLEGS